MTKTSADVSTVDDVRKIDTVTYWLDVHDALVICCEFETESATNLIRQLRSRLSELSKMGQLLVYHDSVANTAYDIWASTQDKHSENQLRERLLTWYAQRLNEREEVTN